jgi:hypothetical protein
MSMASRVGSSSPSVASGEEQRLRELRRRWSGLQDEREAGEGEFTLRAWSDSAGAVECRAQQHAPLKSDELRVRGLLIA